MSTHQQVNRRQFLSLTGRAGGALIIGGGLSTFTGNVLAESSSAVSSAAVTNSDTTSELGVFVSIANNGDVEIICHRAEMGQGILTSVPQLIAEELCADWDRVTAVLGKADVRYGDQSTGGSASIRRFIKHTREMGAVARDMLEQAAANRWAVNKSEVSASQHHVHHSKTGRSFGFGELAADAAKLPVPAVDSLNLKDVKDFTIVGADVALQGLENIVIGQATYAQDIQLPGMLIASIERPPVVGGKVKSFDATNAKAVKGVVDVVQLKDRSLPVNVLPVSGVAVLATNTWAAIEGRKKLKVEWEHGANATHDSEAYKTDLVKKVNAKAKPVRVEGEDIYAHQFDPEKTIEATYTVPYHHHMSMETPAATAVIHDNGHCTVWTGTQTPQWGKNMVLAELGFDPKTDSDKVELNNTLMGGAFGRKGKNDFTIEAVELAKATGKPVKVVWSREDDVKHGFYHSIAANYFKAELNQQNSSDYWLQRLASPPIAWIFNDKATYLDDGALSLGFADVPFDVKNMAFENQQVTTHVRTGWVRSVGNINNAFGLGCFVDELAVKAGIGTREMWMNLFGKDRIFDPRREGFKGYSQYGQETEDYLLDIARFKAVLNEVVDKSNAEETLPEGQGWGISVAASFNSYAAAATKVAVVDGQVDVLEMHTSIDCGLVVTPDRVVSQMEGAMIMGLSMALESEITVKDGAIVQNNFYDYPVSRINKVPPLHVHMVRSNKAPGGVGEPGLPPVMPSIVNAIFHASGVRIRDLPVKKTMKV
ncbi:xanthine dehydrogenase family protein molybdopterin-binding subunit [Arenicella xantha]|uniref:Isoquinoline 1-oxidoreductase beta subunit n=1 Tax=Arenicella xantha TaxID=644221 RepID=A0A395JKP7_9GAMM|nr:molybdopterin cofactor-binding domain-containing protein [Arenicella xantha]RBP51281.1 isoquinoline 1-oxidoreductase beta subunit [Arenicella xantha]